jgi:hypothetical protein
MPTHQFPRLGFQVPIAPGIEQGDELAHFDGLRCFCSVAIVPHGTGFRSLLTAAFLVFFPAAASAWIVSSRFHIDLQLG